MYVSQTIELVLAARSDEYQKSPFWAGAMSKTALILLNDSRQPGSRRVPWVYAGHMQQLVASKLGKF